MNCENCGRPLNEGAKFCPGCGKKVESPVTGTASAENEKPEKKPKKPPLVPILAVVLVLAVCLGSWYVLNRQGQQDAAAPEDEIEDAFVTEEGTQDAFAPEEELAEWIDQAKELYSKFSSDVTARDTDNPDDPAGLGQAISLIDDYLADLAELQTKADAINGLDAKLRGAKDEYFTMLYDSLRTNAECLVFYKDFIAFDRNILQHQPKSEDYDLIEYAVVLYEWTQEAREAYAAISYPVCLEQLWSRYGEILAYTEEAAFKIEEAVSCSDSLRYYSARKMVDRYNILEENLGKKLSQCVASGNSNHANKQLAVANSLLDEMRTYIGLAEEEREAFEFQYIGAGKIYCDFDVIDTIYPSLYNSYDAFAVVKTGCVSGNRTIMVEAEIPGFTQVYRQSFHLDSAYTEIYVKPPALAGELDLTSAKSAQLMVSISEMDGTPINAKSFPVEIKSIYDFEWYDSEYGAATQDNILCYLTPEASAITSLKRQAIDEISAMTGGTMESFVGYQEVYSNQYLNTYLQAAGLMSALRSMGVRYNMDSFSISGSNQRILLPADVIEQRSGLCIETSLVIASALQSADMHAFLVFPPGHAQVAVEVWNSGNHKGEYFLIETTSLGSENSLNAFIEDANALIEGEPRPGIITYYSADGWAEYLSRVEYLIDCNDSQLMGLTPFTN